MLLKEGLEYPPQLAIRNNFNHTDNQILNSYMLMIKKDYYTPPHGGRLHSTN